MSDVVSAPSTAAADAPGGRLQHFPVTFFAVVMGVGGLSLAWIRAGLFLGAPTWIGSALFWLALVLEVLVLTAYLAKVVRHRDAVLAEVSHPVRLAFVPTATIALLLLAAAGQTLVPGLAAVLWWAGAVGQLVVTLAVVSTWMQRGDIGLHHVHPAWFIPVVGPLVVPLAGVRFGPPEVSWFFWSVGLVFWIAMLPIVLQRLFVHETPMPPKLVPTIAVLVAPPAVAFVSLLRLTEDDLSGAAAVLASTAVFFGLLFFVQAGRVRRLPFYLSWWAMSFPMAALSVALIMLAELVGGIGFEVSAWVVLLITTALVVLLAVRTGAEMAAGRICVPE